MYLLNLATCMAESTESFCHDLAQYLEIRLGIPTQCVAGIPWQERERLFDQGAIQVLWLCGLPYVHKAQFKDLAIELLAVPIPLGSRYRAEPIYFSDVVVKRESRFRAFHDLHGSSWAYNEPMSHSGFNVVRAYLAGFGYNQGFFREIVESGSHTASLEMILDDEVEASAIDTTVLDGVIDQRPEVGAQIRVIETIGPSPIPMGGVHTATGACAIGFTKNVSQDAFRQRGSRHSGTGAHNAFCSGTRYRLRSHSSHGRCRRKRVPGLILRTYRFRQMLHSR
jgi:phosphonate transport system substrate-binding protein